MTERAPVLPEGTPLRIIETTGTDVTGMTGEGSVESPQPERPYDWIDENDPADSEAARLALLPPPPTGSYEGYLRTLPSPHVEASPAEDQREEDSIAHLPPPPDTSTLPQPPDAKEVLKTVVKVDSLGRAHRPDGTMMSNAEKEVVLANIGQIWEGEQEYQQERLKHDNKDFVEEALHVDSKGRARTPKGRFMSKENREVVEANLPTLLEGQEQLKADYLATLPSPPEQGAEANPGSAETAEQVRYDAVLRVLIAGKEKLRKAFGKSKEYFNDQEKGKRRKIIGGIAGGVAVLAAAAGAAYLAYRGFSSGSGSGRVSEAANQPIGEQVSHPVPPTPSGGNIAPTVTPHIELTVPEDIFTAPGSIPVEHVDLGGAQYPWDWAVNNFGAENAIDALHSLSEKAQNAGHEIQWTGSGRKQYLRVDGSSETQYIADVLNQFR